MGANRLSNKSRARVERATVRLVETGGCGVLVPGEFILTATHCIDWSGTGDMVLGEYYPTKIETAEGAKFSVEVAACDPRSDLAVLEELDNQAFFDDAHAFEEWREQVEPVPLSTRQFKLQRGECSSRPCPVFIFTHKREWISGSVSRYSLRQSPGSSVALVADIESGTSGSPVITADGMLLGIVSHYTVSTFDTSSMPVAHMALPHWVLARIGVHKVAPADFVKAGAEGGRKAAKNMTKQQRVARARKAGKARQATAKGKK